MAPRLRSLSVIAAAALIITACTAVPDPMPTSPTESTATAPPTDPPSPSSSPSPSPSPTITIDPVPVLSGTARGRVVFVQQAEDASLVAGGRPIRLTLTRTQNTARWFSAPAQRRAGTMSTEQMMLTLGWRPASDGATARIPRPRPQALLAWSGGTMAFTMQNANVRADGTLVLDISPIGADPATVDSYGPVTLTIDGAPGVRVQRIEITAGLISTVTITGREAQHVVVQLRDADGVIVDSRFLAPDRPEVVLGEITVESGARLEQARLRLTPPTEDSPGAVTMTGIIDLAGTALPLDAGLARWTLPSGRNLR
ncbi:MAG: hypothetical protein O2815_12165 [Actinomycetota bacterium]|nr:hypothetical protein [Actinomycetota bacterium]